jgi:hypothetical protein
MVGLIRAPQLKTGFLLMLLSRGPPCTSQNLLSERHGLSLFIACRSLDRNCHSLGLSFNTDYISYRHA